MEKDERPAAVTSSRPPARYLALTITTTAAAAEAVAALLWEEQTGGVIEEHDPSGAVTLRAYLPLARLRDGVLQMIRERLAGLPRWGLAASAPTLSTAEVADEAWASAWKQHFRPFRVGRRILIVPSWETAACASTDVVIRLDPGMAFGSGLHASTQLCLAVLEEQMRRGDSVADVGTGSGILAIAAARLGAAQVLAIDDDPVAVSVASANVRANGVADRVTVAAGDMLAPIATPIDLLMANLTAAALTLMAPAIPPRLRPGGVVIASGIIEAGLDRVREAFAHAGLRIKETRVQEEWRALVAQRAPGPAARC